MDIQVKLIVIAIIVLCYLFLNAILSKEIMMWEPSIFKRFSLLLVVWLIPFIGAVAAYRHLDLSWFKKANKTSNSAQNVIGGALLEVDTIFNPGQRHVIEAKMKEHVELSEDGQLYNTSLPESDQLDKPDKLT